MIDDRNFDVCENCKCKDSLGHCMLQRRKDCASLVFMTELREPTPFATLPDEMFVELLRRRGWHGELKLSETVII